MTTCGMATRVRVAVYKCFSLLLGGEVANYFRDHVAIGSFSAMEKGILVSCSVGNAGPTSDSLSNVAPWITRVLVTQGMLATPRMGTCA
uniref:Subtilisin-like protease n=1 Tax=Cajanus cajan TaxID=3821 RepID=A0A151R1K2_CAJCA|nr:Subtilisin-like protease [Cajanus cajan]